MQITITDLIELAHGITNCGDLRGVKFSYAAAKSLKAANAELETYNTERLKICAEFALKDDDGAPKMKPEGEGDTAREVFDFGENEEAAKVALNELSGMTVDVPIHQVLLDDMPAEITAGQMSGIFNLIREESAGD